MKPNILITGATGFIGRYLVNEFIRENRYNLTLTDIPGADFSCFPDIECIESDIRDRESLDKLVKGKQLLINIAGLVDLSAKAELLNAVNHLGVENLCEAVKNSSVERFIQVSSIGAYGKNEKVPLHEDDEKLPKNDYEKTKWLGEQAAFSYFNHFGITAVRPSAVYGVGSMHNSVLPILNMLSWKKIPYFKKGPLLSHVHVEDTARAILFLAKTTESNGEAYNLADDRPLNGYEMFKALAEPLGLEVKPCLPHSKTLMKGIKFIAQKLPKSFYRNRTKNLQRKWVLFREANKIREGLEPQIDSVWLDYLVADKVCSNEKIKKLGFEFKHQDPEKGLRDLVKFYIDNNYLKIKQ